MMIRIKVNHMQKDANLAEIEMLKAEELEALFFNRGWERRFPIS